MAMCEWTQNAQRVDRYDIINEDDLAQASEKLQAYLAQQTQTPKVVPLKKQASEE